MIADTQTPIRDSIFRQRIAVVADDNPQSLELMTEILREFGFSVISVTSAEDAFIAAKNYIVDLAIVDVFMPGKGGIWMISEFPKLFPEAKIVSVSGGWNHMTPEEAVEAADVVGADAVLTKPFKIEEMIQTISGLVEMPDTIRRINSDVDSET